MSLSRDVNYTKEGFNVYTGDKRKSRENMGMLLNIVVDHTVWNSGKTEVLNSFFATVFSIKSGFQESQVPEPREKGWSKKDIPLVKEGSVRKHLLNWTRISP